MFLPWLLGLLLFLQNCAPVSLQPPAPPLGPKEIDQIISILREQMTRVHTFFSSGRLVAKKYLSRSESNILIVGDRNPLRIKVELTHPWGQPLVHVLIQGNEVRILSFPEKKLYVGQFGSPGLSRFLPGFLGAREIWGVLRGFPDLVKYRDAVSRKDDQITFLNAEGQALQSMDFSSSTRLPRLVFFPGQKAKAAFSNFQESEGIFYAKTIQLDDFGLGASMELFLNRMVFNQTIPEAIFTLDVPPGYETVPFE